MHRPRVEVAAARVVALKDEMVRFDPNGRPAWFELPPDPGRLAEICLDGQRSEVANPALEKLLSAVDETERRINAKPDPGNC